MDRKISNLAKSLSREAWGELLVQTATDPDTAHPLLPKLPPEDIQKLTNNDSGESTMKNACKIYENCATLIDAHLTDLDDASILDFGCGWGRITRFFPQMFALENICGVDVDERLIASCRENLDPMQFEVIVSGEKMAFEDGSFDVVISNSVFSHLSRESHLFYVREIARILRPGGLFLGTTLAKRTMDAMYDGNTDWITKITGERPQAEAEYAAQGFVYGSTGRWTDYGIAFASEEWVRGNWAPEFELVDVVPLAQQVNVARRTAESRV